MNEATQLPLDLSAISEITRATLVARFEGNMAPGALDAADHQGGLPNVLFALLSIDLRGGGRISQASSDLALTVLRESGYIPPDNASDADIVRLLDETGRTFSRSAAQADQHSRELLQACAVALKAGDAYAGLTFLDGPEGAGLGWEMTREAIVARLPEQPSV